ncbi:SDR family oxidoreductase [Roseisolibacter agri]|uniref:Oxidoreductase DltE n=1 Tax=Roseisolibacter agri TaxID=2014610 RepID=A0AA37Q7S1_9BACT|nr:SDR family NAD(P)-dependent oxidoreductase [Roseisolibacter agri]GLC27819.1 putative oxidoreductase DltE [Roseisolibacter agri]
MELSGNTVLVTGGASGIGLAVARRFLEAGSRVAICGRREAALREAAAAHPGLVTRACDLAREEDRVGLVEWALDALPGLNVLVNNAGIQRRFRLAEPEAWAETRQELAINLDAPVHLTLLLLAHLKAQPRAAIVNVTSGLSFVPMASAPVYGATKAALHSFTLALRHQLADDAPHGPQVIEIIPPAVNTDLGGAGLHTFGAPLDAFADAVMARLAAGETEIAYGTAEDRARAAHAAFDEAFARINGRPPG